MLLLLLRKLLDDPEGDLRVGGDGLMGDWPGDVPPGGGLWTANKLAAPLFLGEPWMVGNCAKEESNMNLLS